jgi:hypothetical protein
MAEQTQSFDIFSLLSSLLEAAKDMQYLSWFQRAQIAATTLVTGLGTWDISHGDIKYTVIACLATFAMHTTAMYQASPTDKKNAAAADSIAHALENVEKKGDDDIKKAQIEPAPPKKDSLDAYIDDMEKK